MTDPYNRDPATSHAEGASNALTAREIAERLAAERGISLQETVQGVPVNEILQFTDQVGAWARQLQNGASYDELAADVEAGFAAHEAQYPDAAIWDQFRGDFAMMLLESTWLQGSVAMMLHIRSPHVLVETMWDMLEHGDDAQADLLFNSVQAHRAGLPPEDQLRLSQAMIDIVVETNPEAQFIADTEASMRELDPNHDPMQSWIESQKRRYPNLAWDTLEPFIADDACWGNVPARHRQHALMRFIRIQTLLANEVSTELIGASIEDLDMQQEAWPDSPAWDYFRLWLGDGLAHEGYPVFALDFGRAMRSAPHRQTLMQEFLEQGATDEALELAMGIADPREMVNALLHPSWPEKHGMVQLISIIKDESYPLERRIGLIEAVRDRAVVQLNKDAIKHYNQLLARLYAKRSAQTAPEGDAPNSNESDT